MLELYNQKSLGFRRRKATLHTKNSVQYNTCFAQPTSGILPIYIALCLKSFSGPAGFRSGLAATCLRHDAEKGAAANQTVISTLIDVGAAIVPD